MNCEREQRGEGHLVEITHLHYITVLSARSREREHTHEGHTILLGSMQLQGVCLSNVAIIGAITACKNGA